MWWRRRESNPRPKSLSAERLHAQSRSENFATCAQNGQDAHATSPGSRPHGSGLTTGTSLLCDVLPQPTGKALEDGCLVN